MKMRLSKLEVARRQIESALTLWFQDFDPVSVHTLVAAAHRVVHDIAEREGSGAVLLDKQKLAEWGYDPQPFKKAIRKSETFFKHAAEDPDAMHDYSEKETEWILYSAIECYGRLVHGQLSNLMSVFMMRIAFQNPELLAKPLRDELADILPRIQKLTRSQFLKYFSKHAHIFSG